MINIFILRLEWYHASQFILLAISFKIVFKENISESHLINEFKKEVMNELGEYYKYPWNVSKERILFPLSTI